MSVTTARLVVLGGGPHRASVVPLEGRALVLGRDPGPGDGEQTAVLAGRDVSRRHCQIEPCNGGHRVSDLGSTNGLYVNDRRTTGAILEPFDRVRVGEYDLVYLDGRTDPRKVIALMGRLEETSTFPTIAQLEDELLSMVLGIPDLGSRGELLPLLEGLLEELQRLLRCDWILLTVLEPGERGERMSVIQERGLPPELSGDGAQSLAPLVVECLTEGRIGRNEGLVPGETVCLPLRHQPWTGSHERRQTRAELRGALLLGFPSERKLAVGREDLLLALARQLAILLSNARLHRQANVDALTGLANRRSLEQALATEVRRAEREGTPLGVVLLDVDDFKLINDLQGHEVGDEALRGLGALLLRSLRDEDLAGRWGGEEFLVLLPGADLAASDTVAQKLVAKVAASPSGRSPRISISAGVAVFPDHGKNPNLLVQRADEALYAAKRAGKRCARVYGDEGPGPDGIDLCRTQRVYSETRSAHTPDVAAARAWLLNDLRPPIALCRGTAISIGRSEACDLVLTYPTVSRLHAVVHVNSQGEIHLDDASSNGVRLNEVVLLEQSTALRPGDKIGIGPYVFEVSEQRGTHGQDTQAGNVLAGRLERDSLALLLLWLAQSRCTGLLAVHGGSHQGQLELRDGTIVRASLDELCNEEAVGAVLGLRAGTYSYTRVDVEGAGEMDGSVPELLRRLGEDPDELRSAEELLLDDSSTHSGHNGRSGLNRFASLGRGRSQ